MHNVAPGEGFLRRRFKWPAISTFLALTPSLSRRERGCGTQRGWVLYSLGGGVVGGPPNRLSRSVGIGSPLGVSLGVGAVASCVGAASSAPPSSSGKEGRGAGEVVAASMSNACGLIRTSDSWKVRKPVPAGTRCPRITFSLSPTRLSTLPARARFGEHFGRLLETGGRDEAGTLDGGLRDSQQLRGRGGRLGARARGYLTAKRLDLGVHLFEGFLGDDRSFGEFAVTPVRQSSRSLPILCWRCGTRTCRARCPAKVRYRRSIRPKPCGAFA